MISRDSLDRVFPSYILVERLVVWNMNFMTFHILGIVTPADFYIFQRGCNHQPVQVGKMVQK
jgi:hypothetical protein